MPGVKPASDFKDSRDGRGRRIGFWSRGSQVRGAGLARAARRAGLRIGLMGLMGRIRLRADVLQAQIAPTTARQGAGPLS